MTCTIVNSAPVSNLQPLNKDTIKHGKSYRITVGKTTRYEHYVICAQWRAGALTVLLFDYNGELVPATWFENEMPECLIEEIEVNLSYKLL